MPYLIPILICIFLSCVITFASGQFGVDVTGWQVFLALAALYFLVWRNGA